MNSELDIDWIRDRLQSLTEFSTEIYNVQPDVTNEFSSWSALKLIILSATIDMYTTIMPNYCQNFYYIDALAGSGISEFPDESEYFVGSPILASTLAHESFNRMYLIEQDSSKSRALRSRMDFMIDEFSDEVTTKEYRIVNGDANSVMEEILNEIAEETLEEGEGVNTLSFLDNQGLDINFRTLEEITRLYGDLLINFPTVNVRRTAGADYKTSMNNFYGDAGWRSYEDDDDLRAIYMSNIAGLGRPVQEFIPVNSGGSFFYDMIYATRETQGGSPYIETLKYMKQRVEPLSGDDIETVLRFMRGEQTRVDFFEEDTDEQTGLGDFG